MGSEYNIQLKSNVTVKLMKLIENQSFINFLKSRDKIDFSTVDYQKFFTDTEYRKSLIGTEEFGWLLQRIITDYTKDPKSYDSFFNFSSLVHTFGDENVRYDVISNSKNFFIDYNLLTGFETNNKDYLEIFVNNFVNKYCKDCKYKENCKDKPNINKEGVQFYSCKENLDLRKVLAYFIHENIIPSPNEEGYDIFISDYNGE